MIDWKFIGGLEGGRWLSGYIPNPETSKSGVTIATGCDLGYITPRALAQLPKHLQATLAPYVGKTGAAALQALGIKPLEISNDDADLIDRVMFGNETAALSTDYQHDSGVVFASLPDRAQTVIASVSFQYGSLRRRCPHFWRCVTVRDWKATIAELRDFDDDYPTRRNKEADYLSVILKS